MRNFAGFDTAEVGLGDFGDAVGIVGGIGSATHRSDDGKSPCQSLEWGLFEQKMCPCSDCNVPADLEDGLLAKAPNEGLLCQVTELSIDGCDVCNELRLDAPNRGEVRKGGNEAHDAAWGGEGGAHDRSLECGGFRHPFDLFVGIVERGKSRIRNFREVVFQLEVQIHSFKLL